ncbi:hypothetical protein QYE76_017761 [Lolium multiflorum]|uniref:Peptidase A1 domain-containing protein n=1 Tax=Lolium multiflorum TaxID=4521 RepID=A0AAD8V178_LOLMU|nr:hypothetical protein QYE76_017761 [Lolium multiflorum]
MAERLSRAANRRLAPLNGVTVPVLQDHGGYIAEFDIGHPPQRAQAIVDPMTDLVWTQSSTCRPNCFAQNLGFFNFSLSYTDYPVPCDHSMCAAGYETKPCMGSGDDNDEGTCPVRATNFEYVAAGVLRTDIFMFGEPRVNAYVNITFGCVSQTNFGNLDGASGFLGLGRGALSFVSQVGGNRFSYCLTRLSDDLDPSTLFVGSSAGLGGDGPVTSVPFVESPDEEPFSSLYYLPMSGIEFAGWVFIPLRAFRIRQVAPGLWTGGVVISTTIPVTFLVDEAYRILSQRVSEHLGSNLVPAPVDSGLEFCVAAEDQWRRTKKN